jgi:hypothetical protein
MRADLMRIVIFILLAFLGGGMALTNIGHLLGWNPHYEASWWKVAIGTIVGLFIAPGAVVLVLRASKESDNG